VVVAHDLDAQPAAVHFAGCLSDACGNARVRLIGPDVPVRFEFESQGEKRRQNANILVRNTSASPPHINLAVVEGRSHEWRFRGPAGSFTHGVNLKDDWTLDGENTIFIASKSNGPAAVARAFLVSPLTRGHFVLKPDTLYRFSLLAAVHRCTGKVSARFHGAQVKRTIGVTNIRADAAGGREASGYDHVCLEFKTPAEEGEILLGVEKTAPEDTEESFLFAARPQLVQVSATASSDVLTVAEPVLDAIQQRGTAEMFEYVLSAPEEFLHPGKNRLKLHVITQTAHFVSPIELQTAPSCKITARIHGHSEEVTGWVEGISAARGLWGWAHAIRDRGLPLQAELWLGGKRVAVTAVDRYRPDLGSDADRDYNPGFVFPAQSLVTASAVEGLSPRAALTVRIAGANTPLDGAALPDLSGLQQLVEHRPGGQRSTNALKLPAALDVLHEESRVLLRRPLRSPASACIGYLERFATVDQRYLLLSGWMNRDTAVEQSAVLLQGEKHKAAVSFVTFQRSDLPAHAVAFAGLVRTDWEPPQEFNELLLFLGSQGEKYLRPNLEFKRIAANVLLPTDGNIVFLEQARLPEIRRILFANEAWLPQRDGAQVLGVRAGFDKVCLLPDFGIIASGWIIEGPQRTTSLAFRLGDTVFELDQSTLRRVPRPDLASLAGHAKAYLQTAGFSGLFRGRLTKDSLLDPMFRVRFIDGSNLTISIDPAAITQINSNFDFDQLNGSFDSLAFEPRFAEFASARSAMVKRALVESLNPVISASGENVLLVCLPRERSEMLLVLEGLCRNAPQFPAETAIAIVGDIRSDRYQVLSWLDRLQEHRAASLTLVENVHHALYAASRILALHGAKRFAYVGPNVWLTDACWKGVCAALAGKHKIHAPLFFPVHSPHQNWRSESDSELFVWTRKELNAFTRAAPVPFDEFASDRGLPEGASIGDAIAFRFHLPEMSRYKALLDKVARRNGAGSG